MALDMFLVLTPATDNRRSAVNPANGCVSFPRPPVPYCYQRAAEPLGRHVVDLGLQHEHAVARGRLQWQRHQADDDAQHVGPLVGSRVPAPWPNEPRWSAAAAAARRAIELPG